MNWNQVRDKYPNQLVLIEAINTSTKNTIRTIEDMSILASFEDSITAWKKYKELHKKYPNKELYIFHTSKENAEVIKQYFIGIRGQVCD